MNNLLINDVFKEMFEDIRYIKLILFLSRKYK